MSDVLVISGDTPFMKVVLTTLKANGISCVFTDSMFKAAQKLQSGPRPAIIMIDLALDQSVKFIKEVKKQAAFGQIPVLAVTTDPSLPEVKDAIEAGANRWLTKSFVGNTLLGVMRQFSSI